MGGDKNCDRLILEETSVVKTNSDEDMETEDKC